MKWDEWIDAAKKWYVTQYKGFEIDKMVAATLLFEGKFPYECLKSSQVLRKMFLFKRRKCMQLLPSLEDLQVFVIAFKLNIQEEKRTENGDISSHT